MGTLSTSCARSILVLGAILALTGCGLFGDGLTRLARFVAWNTVGSSQDYWLVKGSSGIDDRVALIFGYMDDGQGCYDIALGINERFPQANYSCRPAN